jgi:hypothetical protein
MLFQKAADGGTPVVEPQTAMEEQPVVEPPAMTPRRKVSSFDCDDTTVVDSSRNDKIWKDP